MSKKNDLIISISEKIDGSDRSTRIAILKLLLDNGVTVQEKFDGCSIRYSNLKKDILSEIINLIDAYELTLSNNQQIEADEG